MSDVAVVADDTHRRHDPPFELNSGQRVSPVWERPARAEAIAAALREAGYDLQPAQSHDDRWLEAVHDPEMVAFLRAGYVRWREAGGPDVMIADTFRSPALAGGGRRPASPFGELGWWCFDTATPLVEGSYAAGRAAVDVALTAADLVADGSERLVYGLTRPPGHHAGGDYFGGFCLFNHAAVAARRLTEGGRVAVVDVDVHHGNGTQDLFWYDGNVLYVSLHGDPDHVYPFFSGFSDEEGVGPGRGATRNLPLGPGTGDDAYLAALDIACEVVDAFDPATIVVSLGVDTAEVDPIAPLELSPAAYPQIGHRLGALGRPTLVLQEGGYAIDHLGAMVVDVLGAMARASSRRGGSDGDTPVR